MGLTTTFPLLHIQTISIWTRVNFFDPSSLLTNTYPNFNTLVILVRLLTPTSCAAETYTVYAVTQLHRLLHGHALKTLTHVDAQLVVETRLYPSKMYSNPGNARGE